MPHSAARIGQALGNHEKLMAERSTDVIVPVGADGTIALTGFYGDYAVDVPGRTLSFELVKGKIAYDVR